MMEYFIFIGGGDSSKNILLKLNYFFKRKVV